MAVRSACNGKVQWDGTDIPHVRSWTFDRSEDVTEYSSSSTNCAKQRLSTVEDVTGTVEVYIDPDDAFEAILDLGDTGTFKLYEDATDFWTVPAIITGVSVNAPIEAGDPVEATISFEGNGNVIAPVR